MYEVIGINNLVKLSKLSRPTVHKIIGFCKDNNFVVIENKHKDSRLRIIRLTKKGEYYLKRETMFLDFERDLKKFDETMKAAFP